MSNRRSFLRLVGMAPIAAPVAAREAAASIGLKSAIGAAAVGINSGVVGAGLDPPAETHEQYLVRSLKEIMRPEASEEARREISTMLLDPDLASMRSMSLSAVRAIQVERLVDRTIQMRKSYLEKQLKRWSGGIL
jgi:hypothetical protein